MKTPEQIRDMEFQKNPMGGYKQSDVELFLEEVASQIEILMKQKADADRKLQEISKKTPEAALSTAGIQNVLVSAQRVADKVVEDANAEAEKILANAKLKLAEADVRAGEVIADAENKAYMLGNTAENEAAKIIASAVKKAEEIMVTTKASVEVEQKLYDRLKIEVADFRRKAIEQFSYITELINQLPSEIPLDIDRAKDVLSTDFGNPEELLKKAIEEKATELDPVEEEPVAEPVVEEKPEAEVAFESPAVEVQATPVEEPNQEPMAEPVVAEQMPLTQETQSEGLETEDQKPQGRGHITFSDDDDDDEPRMFFRKKRK